MRSHFSDYKNLFAGFVIVLLILIAWLKLPDKISASYTDAAMVTTGVAYASARTINALISTFQTAQVSIGFASISIGELLDPINDLVERFSAVMMWCLGSLALQKILIAAVATKTFQIIFTVIGMAALLNLFFKNKYLDYALKAFALFAALRFGLFVVLLLNGAFETAFLRTQIDGSQQQMDEFRSELAIFESEIPDTISDDIENAVTRLERMKANKAATVVELARISERLAADRESLEELQISIKPSLWPWGELNLSEEETVRVENEIALLTAEIRSLETQHEIATQDIESFTQQITSQIETVECLQKKEQGQSCTWSLQDYVPSIGLSAIKSFERTFKATLQSIFTLLVALLMQSIILPLLFLWLVKRGFIYLWQSIFSDTRKDTQEVKRGRLTKRPPAEQK